MGHACGVLHQAFHPTEGFGQAEQLGGQAEGFRLLFGVEDCRDHAAEAFHLACGNLVARVCCKPWVTHPGHGVMAI